MEHSVHFRIKLNDQKYYTIVAYEKQLKFPAILDSFFTEVNSGSTVSREPKEEWVVGTGGRKKQSCWVGIDAKMGH